MPGVLYDLQGDLLIQRVIIGSAFRGSPPSRSIIESFTERSQSRLRRYLRTCEAEYSVFITLTYPFVFPTNGRTAKQHLRAFFERVRRNCNHQTGTCQSKFSACWFMEFQERGAPHFHILANFKVPKDELSRWWYEIVGSDDKRHLLAGTRVEYLRGGRRAASAYAAKYAAKSEQKKVPEGFTDCGRFWGVFGNRKTVAAYIFVPSKQTTAPPAVKFREALRNYIKGSPLGFRRIVKNGVTVGFYIRNSAARDDVIAIFHRFGPALVACGCVFDFPGMELVGGWEEGFG